MYIQTINFKNILCVMLLFFLGVLPSLAGKYLNASSTTLGVLIFIFILAPFYVRLLPRLYYVKYYFVLSVTFFIVFMLVQGLFVSGLNIRAYLSVPIVILFLVSAFLISSAVKGLENVNYLRVIHLLNNLLIFIAVFNIATGFQLGRTLGGSHSDIYPFGEPSHFALFLGPLAISEFVLSEGKYRRYIIAGMVFLIGITIPNMTLLVYVVLMLLLVVKLSKSSLIAFSLFLLCGYIYLITSDVKFDYFIERLTINNDSENLSTLVYLQGIDYSLKSLSDTFGLGVGFQMMGTQEQSSITQKIVELSASGTELNRLDGGFLAAKLVTEFGFLGCLLVIIFISKFIKSFLYLRRSHLIEDDELSTLYVISTAVVYSFIVEMFVRGIGYFTSTIFLFLVAVFIKVNIDRCKHI